MNDEHNGLQGIYKIPAPPPPDLESTALPTEVLFGRMNQFVAIRESFPPPPEPQGVHTLPSEVLFKIFETLATPDTPQTMDPCKHWDEPLVSADWLVVNLVCKHWHRVACEFPLLWRAIDVGSSVDWLGLCLKRSGSAPLDIRLYDSAKLLQAAVLLLGHVRRIRSLRVTKDAAADSLHALGSLFMVGMPALEGLYLDANKHDAPFSHKNLHDVFRLDATSENLFPSLRTLFLDALYLPPTPALLRGLRVLVLRDAQPAGEAHKLTLPQFLDALEACPTLEWLRLWDAFPFCLCNRCDDPAQQDVGDRAVALPNLRRVAFACSSSPRDGPPDTRATRCRRLLSHLRLSELAEVTVYVSTLHGLRKSFHDHLPDNPECLPIVRAADKASFKGPWEFEATVGCACDQCIEEAAWLRRAYRDEEGRGADLPWVALACEEATRWGLLSVAIDSSCNCAEVNTPTQADDAAREFAELLAAAPLRWLDVVHGPTRTGFGNIFGAFGGLVMLVLGCGWKATSKNMLDFFDALAPGPYALGGGGAEAPLPQLRALRLHQARWYSGLARDLRACLHRRRLVGARLADLHVQLMWAPGVKGKKQNNARMTHLRGLVDLVRNVEVKLVTVVANS